MNIELVKLCSEVSSQIKLSNEYLNYQESLKIVINKYPIINELKKLSNESKKDYLKIRKIKDELEKNEDYLKYLSDKRDYENLLRSTLKDIMDSIDENIAIKGII